jgi:hypothetical protein
MVALQKDSFASTLLDPATRETREREIERESNKESLFYSIDSLGKYMEQVCSQLGLRFRERVATRPNASSSKKWERVAVLYSKRKRDKSSRLDSSVSWIRDQRKECYQCKEELFLQPMEHLHYS